MSSGKILIVEDNTDMAETTRDCLEDLGYGVSDIVPTGREAIESAEMDRPDCILMDIKLKGDMDGIETAEEIQAGLNVPVIFLSAFFDSDLLQRAKKSGSFGYLVKPFGSQELHTMLEMTLYKTKVKKEQQKKETALIENEKLKAVIETIGGICHEINQPLMIILNATELLLDDPSDPHMRNMSLIKIKTSRVVTSSFSSCRSMAEGRNELPLTSDLPVKFSLPLI